MKVFVLCVVLIGLITMCHADKRDGNDDRHNLGHNSGNSGNHGNSNQGG